MLIRAEARPGEGSPGILRGAGDVVGAAHCSARASRRGHFGADTVQGVEAIRQAGEAAAEEAGVVVEALRPRQRPGPGYKGHDGEDQAAVRQLREARAAVRDRWAAPPHRERGPAPLGGVHHPGNTLPLHRRVDWVGGSELLDRHQGREEAHHEGDHNRRSTGLAPHVQGLHLAGRCVQRVLER